MEKLSLFLFAVIFLLTPGCRKDSDQLVGPFKDKLPVVFRYYTISNLTPTYIHINGETSLFTVSNRERVLVTKMSEAERQVNYIRLISSDKAQIYGAIRNGTPFTLDAKYSQSGNNYIFNSNYITGDIRYTTKRFNDTMVLDGIVVGHYNTVKTGDEAAYIQINGFTLQDAINKLPQGDTLYYKLFDVLLIKEK